MIHKNKVMGAFATLVVSALVLTGCSGGEPNGDTNGSSGEPDSSAVAQSLTVAPINFPASLDIVLYPAEEGVLLFSEQVLDTLVRATDGAFEPRLADDWENPDPNTWVFNLREGVTFSDGTPFTSSDVKATMERHVAIESVLAPLLAAVVDIDDSDPAQVVITTETPLGNLLGTLSLMYVGVGESVNDEAYWLAPIGTGPFKVDSYTPDDSVKMSRNDSYWGTPAILDTLEFVQIPEASSRLTGLETGEVDVTTGVAADQLEGVRSIDGVTVDSVDSLTYWLGWFNHEDERVTSDVRVRQALWHAVDFETIIPALYGDTASIGRAPVAAAAFGAPVLEPYAYDPELAKQLLADAGYPNGLETTLSWPIDGGPNIKELAQVMISAWAEIGVTVTPVESQRANWVDDLLAHNWDIQIFTNTTQTGDADFTIGRLYTSAADRLGFASDEVDAWLAEAASSVDQDRRKELFGLVSEYLWDNAVGYWPAQIKINVAYQDDITGLELPANGRIQFAVVERN